MVLKRKNFNESPLQVVAVEDASGVVGKGENYLSEIERVRATVLLGSGKTKKISLIIKNQHETEQMKKLSLELGVFFREITMYRDILPKMEDLLDEIKEEEDLLWGRCYDYRLYDRLVFEDLNEAGFRMADRKKQLGLQAALLVVKNLAKFHALSKILLDRGEIPLDVFGKHIWAREPEISKRMVTENAERLLKVMKTWGDEWQEASERFEKAIPDLGKKFAEELTVKPDEFAVLCHGDCWTNNMLFKGEDLENPTAVKLLDLQISFLSTPAWDLHYFFKTSVRLEVRKKHTDQILQEYVNSWKSLTSRLPYGAFVPDVDYVKENMRKKAVFALEYCTNLISIITGDTRDNADLEDVMKALKEAEDKGEKIPVELWDLSKMMTPNTINIIKDIITDSIEFGIM
ncbi:hypothetical protein GE061_017251 [Apolygus lucorum]|uniref:CHK kinase-like domain-containing protein n=1 Tax=Apolygus lucorum TaxID=248454 RepID=A0A6A4JIC0_APOLU|nr:hypothetical protein GE061_017251 [Apolygus lucorum]